MQLFDAIIEANQRAVAGDAAVPSVNPADFSGSLPLIALTCVDPRLNRLFPGALGITGEYFISLRNAGNIITSSLSSTMRSLALACAVKNGREIAILGHTDCHICRTSMLDLISCFEQLGIQRSRLPEDLVGFFGMFASERQNVIKAVDFVRASPLIGPKIPVHGLLIDTATGKLEWVVNGYQQLEATAASGSIGNPESTKPTEQPADDPTFAGGKKVPEPPLLSTPTQMESRGASSKVFSKPPPGPRPIRFYK